MPDYQKMYYLLVSRVSDAVNILVSAQQEGEDEFVENPPQVVPLATIMTDQNKEADT